jgi:hypothetical protein
MAGEILSRAAIAKPVSNQATVLEFFACTVLE